MPFTRPCNNTASRKVKQMRRPILFLPALAGLGLLLWLSTGGLRESSVSPLPIEQRTFIASLVVSGRIATPSRVLVASEVLATVRERRVSEGDRVEAGQILVVLDEGPLRARQAEIEAQLAQLQERLRPETEASLSEASARRRQAEREARRARELARAGLIPESEKERAEEALAIAEAQERRLAALARAYAPNGVEEQLLRARAAALEAERARYQVRSQVAGIVLRRFVEPGDVAQPGRPLLEIAAEGPVEAICQAEERQLERLALGQRAVVVPDAWPELRAEATLVHIAPAVDPTTGGIELRFRLGDPPPELRQDMTVSVEVELARLEGALVVANEALGGADGRRIRLARAGRVEELEVRVLARGLAHSAIAGPLRAGEQALVYAEAPPPGRRVRLR
jgi:HlyD family secretion protein